MSASSRAPDPAGAFQTIPILYVRRFCPYCVKVLRHAERIGFPLDVRDIGADRRHLADLLRIGGRRQVPCLVMGDRALYESDDIIAWMDERSRVAG